MKRDYCSPGKITFSKDQVKWLIEHLLGLREGVYPKAPTGTVGRRGKRSIPWAAFETPAGLAAEIDERLERAGLNGLILEYIYILDTDDKKHLIRHLSKMLNLTEAEVEERAGLALEYVSGEERKASPEVGSLGASPLTGLESPLRVSL